MLSAATDEARQTLVARLVPRLNISTAGGLRDRLALLCYGFDAASGRYSLAIRRILTALTLAFAVLVGGTIAALLIREKRKEAP